MGGLAGARLVYPAAGEAARKHFLDSGRRGNKVARTVGEEIQGHRRALSALEPLPEPAAEQPPASPGLGPAEHERSPIESDAVSAKGGS